MLAEFQNTLRHDGNGIMIRKNFQIADFSSIFLYTNMTKVTPLWVAANLISQNQLNISDPILNE